MKKVVFLVNILLFCSIFMVGCSDKRRDKSSNNSESDISIENQKNMKLGIILETKEPEKAWNAFRFAVTSLKKGHVVKVFLMGEAVECQEIKHERFNVREQMYSFLENGGDILACGTCIKSRNMEESEVCPISTMIDCVEMVEWADKVLTF